MRVSVSHNIGDLAADCARIPVEVAPRMAKVVRKNVEQGRKVAQGIARAKAGPHGTNAYKRITSEMTGALEGEFGWTGDVAAIVGVGWRNGPPNTDLAKAADLQAPRFASDAAKTLNGLYW